MKKKLYYQKKATEGLKGGPNYVKRTTSGFIESDYGQWEFPGEPTLINSNSITMKGVPYPVFGMDDLGNSQMMYPEQNYLYPGNKVYEIPMAQKGYNVKPRVGSITLKGQTEPSTHYMMREYGPTGWVAFPSIFQNPDNSWVNMSDEKDWMKIYKEAQKRGEVYNFGEDEEAAINFADKGSWKKELGIKKHGGWLDSLPKAQRGTIYVDNPNDPRLQAYNDSLSLYKAYIMQDKLMGPNYDNENTNRRFAPPISDWTIKKLKEGRVKRIFPGLEDYGPISKDFQNERDMFKANFFVTDADKKLIKYYKSLGFNDDNIMYHTSADVIHPTIKAIGSYNDGSAWSPIYKKPVQPYKYKKPEVVEEDIIYVDDPNDPNLLNYQKQLEIYNKFNTPGKKVYDNVPIEKHEDYKFLKERGLSDAEAKKQVQKQIKLFQDWAYKNYGMKPIGYNFNKFIGNYHEPIFNKPKEYRLRENKQPSVTQEVKKEEPIDRSILTYRITELPKEEQRGNQRYVATVVPETYQKYGTGFAERYPLTQEQYDAMGATDTMKSREGKDIPVKYIKKTGGWLDKAQKGKVQVRPSGYIGAYPTWSGDTGIEGDFGANVDFGNINFDLANRFNIESNPEYNNYFSPYINANIPFNDGRGNINFSAGSFYNQPNITSGINYRFGYGGGLDTYQERGEVKPKFQYNKTKDLGTFLKEATKPKPSMYEFNNKGLSKQEALEANRAQDATRVAGFRQNLPSVDLGPKVDPSGQYLAEMLVSPYYAAKDIYDNPLKYGKTLLNLAGGAFGAIPITEEGDLERVLNMAEVTPMLGGIGSLTKKPLSNAVNALRYRDLSSKELKKYFTEAATKLKNNLDNKFITPLQFKKEIKDLKEYSNKSAEFWKTPEGRRRLEDIGITPEKMIPYNLTFRSDEKTKYFSPTATVNINFRELNKLKKERGLDLTPRTALEHEVGHHLQRESYRMNDYLKDIKKFQDELAEWKQRQIEAKKTTNPFKRNIYNWLYDPEPTTPTLLSKPTKIDEALKTLEATPEAIQQLANIEGSSRTMTSTPELTRAAESLDYWHNLEKGDVERLPHLRELRQNMMNKGIINNLEDRITKDMVIDYFNSTKGDRIGSFVKKSPINLRFLTEQLNNAPALIPAIGLTGLGAAGYNQLNNNTMYKKGGWLDNLPKAQVGEEVSTIGPIDLPAIEISDKADPRALINQGAFFGKEPSQFIRQFRNRLPQLFYTEQGTSGYGPMNQGSINLPSTDISAPFVDPNTGEVDYGKMAFAGLEGIASGFVGASTPKVPKAAVNYLQPSKFIASAEYNPFSFANRTPKSNAPVQWQMKELPGLHLKSTVSEGPVSKIVEPKTGLINVEQALGIIGKESGGADKVSLIKQGLGNNIPKKMDYNEFRKIVQDQLIPLERKLVDYRSEYGVDNLGYAYLEDIVRDAQGNAIRKKYNVGEQPLENQTLILSNKSKFGRGSSAHGNPDETLGHIHFLRDAKTPDVLTVTQIQSDAFQGTHRIMPKTQKEALEKVNKLKEEGKEIKSIFNDGNESSKSVLNNYEKHLQLDEATAKNFTQKQLLDKSHQERYLQELVNYAAERGDINKVRVPTSETAARVQGYRSKKTWNINNLSNGDEVVLTNGIKGKVVDNLFDNSIGILTKDGKKINVDMSDAGYGESRTSPIKSVNNVEVKEVGKYSDEEQTILKKYAEQPKTIKKIFGVEPKTVTDDKGNTWYEFDIPKSYKEGKGEIKAYKLGGQKRGWLDNLNN